MSLSDEEFQRFQNQLVELKTKNYQFEEQNKRLTAENVQLKTQIETNEKDSFNFRLPTKMLNLKLRKNTGPDPEEVQRENEALSRKVHSQEEEFKLQNETMMRELKERMNEIEELQNELKSYKEGRRTSLNSSQEGTEVNHLINEESRRLKAENNVLQKKLSELSSKIVESISTASSSNESFQKEDLEVDCEDNRSEAGLVHIVSNKTSNGETKLFDSNSLRLETEQEEKRLLQDQLRQLELSSNETNSKLSKQIDNLKEKLDEKQNTCLQLQRDYEKRIQEIIAENNNIKTTNELQIDVLKSDIKRLQEELQTLTKHKDEEISKYQKRVSDLQTTSDQLESQIGTVAAEQNLQLRTANAEHQRILENQELLLNQTILDRDTFRTENEQSKEAYETLLQTVQALEQQLTTKARDYESQFQIAEQRKATVDEMAANSLQVEEKNKSILQNIREKYQTDVEKLEKEINDLKIKDRTLKQYQTRCTDLENRLKSEEESKHLVTTRLEQSQIEINEIKETSRKQIDDLQIKHESILSNEHIEHHEQTQNFNEILSTKAHTIDELNAQIDVLKQEAAAFVDDKRTHERKGAALMKDLQKQLNAEKKKNERMQEKLTELLSGDKSALDELFYIPKSDESRTASVSSFGGGGDYPNRLNVQTSVTSTQMSAGVLEQENKELIQRLARAREECAILEERVRHLESSSSAMANDLIHHYSYDKHPNHRYATPPSHRRQASSNDRQSSSSLNFRQMFGGNKNPTANDEIIKNLQRALEETLTKNMHLEKNLEAMSLQLQNQSSA